jgi:hypothetical protein
MRQRLSHLIFALLLLLLHGCHRDIPAYAHSQRRELSFLLRIGASDRTPAQHPLRAFQTATHEAPSTLINIPMARFSSRYYYWLLKLL